MALPSSAASTDESTPPERASSTLPSPISALRRSTVVLQKSPMVQSPFAPQISNRKFFIICLPY